MTRKRWSEKRRDDLAGDLDILLGDLCLIWGFCNSLSGATLVQDHPCLTGEVFATAVLRAEGWSLGHHGEWQGRIMKVFRDRYGQAVSLADFVPVPSHQNAPSTSRRFRPPR
jgi:hypothetical protein